MKPIYEVELEKMLKGMILNLWAFYQKESLKQLGKACEKKLNKTVTGDLEATLKQTVASITDANFNRKKILETLLEHRIKRIDVAEIIGDTISHLSIRGRMQKMRPEINKIMQFVREECSEYQRSPRLNRLTESQERTEKVRSVKNGFGLTHKELAEIVGVSERTIFNWLSREVSFNRLAREKIDKIFEVYKKISTEVRPDALRRWLLAQNELLGDSHFNLLAKSEFEKVLADIDALREGVHV